MIDEARAIHEREAHPPYRNALCAGRVCNLHAHPSPGATSATAQSLVVDNAVIHTRSTASLRACLGTLEASDRSSGATPFVLWDYANALGMTNQKQKAIGMYNRILAQHLRVSACAECGEAQRITESLRNDCRFCWAACDENLGNLGWYGTMGRTRSACCAVAAYLRRR